MYAVVQTSGRQFKVSVGDIITVDRIQADAGDTIKLDRVLMLGGEGVTLGAPVIEGASVTIKVLSHFKGEKRITRKYRRRQRTRRKVGYRPAMSSLEIVSIDQEG
ncbi:MAG: large subunit ribosomal protein L21 [Kiritimatiellia bacterium]|jgi:large subunit ribosomal protein L21